MSEHRTVEDCDLCIAGAGICGLNFLFSASQHMTKENKVVLVDRNPSFGGMWNDTYSYVRLHQPHPMFTVGNFSWSLEKERSHLATREEVLGHFAECLDRLRDRVTLVERYGYAYQEHEEARAEGGVRAEVRLRPTASNDHSPVSIQSTSSVYGFQSFSGYWLGQLLFEDKLRDVPLYTLDNERLFAENNKAFTYAWMTQLLYNTILIMDAVPARAFRDCGLNFDNWYPPYRQLPFLLKLKMNRGSYLEHFRRSLDRVCERAQVQGGPLAATK